MPSVHAQPARRQLLFSSLDRTDWLLLFLVACFAMWMCKVRSAERLLWADELLGDRLLNESSVRTMFRGWWEGADGGGPLYYLFGRLWVTVTGHSALSLRLFSTAGMLAGIVCVWAAARRRFSTPAVAWSVALLFLYAWVPRWQLANGRFYGFFFASAAFASLCFLQTADGELTPGDLLVTAGAHTLLVGSHILGFIYSFGLIVGMVAMDVTRGRLRWRLYAAAASGWTVLTFAWHGIYRSTSIAKGVFWTLKPGALDLLLGFSVYNKVLLRILMFVLVLALAKRAARQHPGAFLPGLLRLPMFWLSVSLCLAQSIIFVKSQLGISIYADRYLLPLAVVSTLLFAAAFDEAFAFAQWTSRAAWALAMSLLLLAPCAAYAYRQRDYAELYPKPGLPQRMLAQMPEHAAVLVTYLPDFTFLSKYDPSRQYFFLMDWPYDLEEQQKRHADLSAQREMLNWKRANLLPGRIVDCPLVFEANRDLYILLDPGRRQWLTDRVLHDPNYTAQQLSSWEEWYPYTVWHVHQTRPGTPPC